MITVKPITGVKLPIVKTFEKIVLSELPFHKFEAQQKRLRKSI